VITGATARPLLGQRLRRRWQGLADAVAPPPLILMYHRVAEPTLDPWQLCVSPDHFAAQMQALRRQRRPVALAELTHELAQGRCPRGAVVVTFDDGYADNLSAALPVLEAFEVPATVFCTSGAIGAAAPFWWDRLAGLLLRAEPLPSQLTLRTSAQHRSFALGAAAHYDDAERAADRRRSGDDDDRASPRLRLYREVWAWLRELAPADRAQALDQIAAWCGGDAADVAQPLSCSQARALAASALIEIGAHTVSHPALSTLAPDEQRAEIAQSKAQLEALVARPLTSFAYPFGDQGVDTAGLVREAGFRAACTTEAAAVRRGADPCQLPRIAVGDWDAATLARRLWGRS
jgi:peptidoglycan/xylan/chitin deacetylase (PgdA/CDA1 family)